MRIAVRPLAAENRGAHPVGVRFPRVLVLILRNGERVTREKCKLSAGYRCTPCAKTRYATLYSGFLFFGVSNPGQKRLNRPAGRHGVRGASAFCYRRCYPEPCQRRGERGERGGGGSLPMRPALKATGAPSLASGKLGITGLLAFAGLPGAARFHPLNNVAPSFTTHYLTRC